MEHYLKIQNWRAYHKLIISGIQICHVNWEGKQQKTCIEWN